MLSHLLQKDMHFFMWLNKAVYGVKGLNNIDVRLKLFHNIKQGDKWFILLILSFAV